MFVNREEFEKLPEIAERIKRSEAFYCSKGNWYLSPHEDCREDEAFLDGAWYAWQEQQKKIEKHNTKIVKFINDLDKCENEDKDNPHDYWRGFSECAGSVKEVFLRDVGVLK